MKFEGIYTPAITPLSADGSIDTQAFAEVLEFLVESKVHGIVIGGSTGEYYAHTAEERLALAAHASEVIAGRLPLVVGTGAIRTEDSLAYAEAARAIGADAILVGSPPYALPTSREIAEHVLAVDRAAGLPIMLYNYPARMGVEMDEAFFAAVAGCRNIVAIKESSGSTAQLHRLACRHPRIALSCGWDDQALEFFAWGARSWVCAGSNFIPGEHLALYQACVVENDFAKGRRIMAAMMPLMDFLESGHFVQSIKHGCELAGLRAGGVRAPLKALDEAGKAALAEIVARLKGEVARIVEGGRWRSRTPAERKAALLRLAELLEEHLLELAVMESLDSGKPIRECQHTDLPETINTLRWHAELIDKIYDSTAPVGSAALAMVVREPIGVVGLVLPWNFPLLMLAWKIGPALAAGCSVVVKPAPETSLTALRVAELASQAGIPAGVFNVVPGGGREAGEPLGRHPDVAMVSFTGSTATGRLFLKYAAESNLKRVVLECGGKNPAVVMNDVEDLDLVAQHVVNGAFWNMGENCSASSRLIVHAEVREALLERIGAQLREWRMGDPLDPRNRLGALVSPAHFEKVRAYLDQARTERLAVRFGGATEAGIFVEPTVVDGVSPHSRLFREEIFGPLLSVTSFDDIDEAIALANDTVYGLAASAYTGSLRHALRLSREIRAGIVTVNCFGEGDASTPFGGYKESGFGGRDKSVWAHDQYTELKTIWIDAS